ncbi:Hypothetical protein NTJ_06960 [Nesidiocoris tenuis]|uniref:Uncharacterized protein n=1 Tax=Nesidiocoris tenuis TaxID=355587 RepID=A0ABN7APK3_9HEMI|nr:Hypothetical protein NTJ_06960 [Nesidiocoris tenuis]
MLIRDLDDAGDTGACRKKPKQIGNRGTQLKIWQKQTVQPLASAVTKRGRGRPRTRPKEEPDGQVERRVTRSQTRALQKTDPQFVFSESDSEDEAVGSKPASNPNRESPKRSALISAKDRKLLKDLQLSDDSDDSSSSEEDSSGSDDTSSEKSSDGTTIEPLWTSLIGEGYFWIKKTKPTLKEELNFADVSLNDDDKTVVRAYKVFCRESPVEKAVCVFAEKLKHLQLKKCLALLTQYRQIFKTQFFHPQMKSMDLFGTIVMTLVRYYYNKCDFSATVALINFVDINCRLNPSDYRPYDVQNSIYSQLTESATALMCCDAAYRHLDIKCCSRLFTRYFKNVVSKMDTANVDRMKPLMRMFFQHLISANMPRPLIVFFSNIFEIQENLDHPFNLSEFYGATVSVLAASDDSHDHRLIVNLFLKVSTWMATDLTSVACRGLLVAAAQLNEPRAHIDLIFKDAVYAGAYPHWEPFEWKISLYSVMTKVEMQIYIEQFFHSRAELVWTQRLPICSTFMIFHVEHVSSSPVRDYVYPVQLKMRNVDNSVGAAIDRLKSVVEYILEQPADEVVKRFDENGLIMFSKQVEKLFKKILRVDSLDKTPDSNCVLCK